MDYNEPVDYGPLIEESEPVAPCLNGVIGDPADPDFQPMPKNWKIAILEYAMAMAVNKGDFRTALSASQEHSKLVGDYPSKPKDQIDDTDDESVDWREQLQSVGLDPDKVLQLVRNG